jgi:hypothetical protein
MKKIPHHLLKESYIIVSTNGKEYRKISDVPISEYLNIHIIKDIPAHFLKDEYFFGLIEPFTNLRFISCDYENWTLLSEFPILDKIAIFQKLSIFGIIDYHRSSFIPFDVGKYVWGNKMIIFGSKVPCLENINSDIEYLNIINTEDIDYTNIPDTIQYLHLSIRKIFKYKQSNLPIGLKTLIVTIPEMYKSYTLPIIHDSIIPNTKLPFGCELIIDDVFH